MREKKNNDQVLCSLINFLRTASERKIVTSIFHNNSALKKKFGHVAGRAINGSGSKRRRAADLLTQYSAAAQIFIALLACIPFRLGQRRMERTHIVVPGASGLVLWGCDVDGSVWLGVVLWR